MNKEKPKFQVGRNPGLRLKLDLLVLRLDGEY